MADNGMILLDYVLGFDYLFTFVGGLFVGIWLTRKCIRLGIKMTQDIQTDYPFDNDTMNKEISKE